MLRQSHTHNASDKRGNMRAAIYARVSPDDGRQTVENQRQRLSEFCGRMGWVIVAEFNDAKSEKSLDRAGFKTMMETVSRREFDVLVFWDLSRLSLAESWRSSRF
jgi:DNA invertase Pin-like site-specific DNA recombinase